MNTKEIQQLAEFLFGKKGDLDHLHQEIAENFYPERAWFTSRRSPGDEFASHLMSGYPALLRRELGNAIGGMLRKDKWFKLAAKNPVIEKRDIEARRYLEWLSDRQRALMYDKRTGFVRASKECDHDYVAFGQGVTSCEIKDYSHFVYRTWHLKDCAWAENDCRMIDTMVIRHKMPIRTMVSKFKGAVHPTIQTRFSQGKGFDEVECMWVVYPHESGNGYESVHLDNEKCHEMERVQIKAFPFSVPRWQTVSESPYSYSPATIVALPDARLIQAMTVTLLEAGEMSVRPPMLAVQEAIRSDVQLVSGGITWVDREYDERLGEVLRPLSQDRGGFPAAFRMEEGIKFALAEAFFINKLNLPITNEMTAYETSERIKEHIRNLLPIFEPAEDQINAQICELTFAVGSSVNAFRVMDIPRSLLGEETEYVFESPIRDATNRENVEQFRTAVALCAEAAQIDQTLPSTIHWGAAFRDAMLGMGAPATWQKTEAEAAEAMEQMRAAMAEQQETGQVIDMMKARRA